jgi:hypothetical protein
MNPLVPTGRIGGMRYRLRTLLIVIAVVGTLLVIYREVRGRIELEPSLSTGSSPLMVFHVATPDDALSLRDEFDQQAFARRVQNEFQRAMKRENVPPMDLSLHVMDVTDAFCFKYDYVRLGRRRFDLLKW